MIASFFEAIPDVVLRLRPHPRTRAHVLFLDTSTALQRADK